MKINKIAVLGFGSFGDPIAEICSNFCFTSVYIRDQDYVDLLEKKRINERYYPEHIVPPHIHFSSNIHEVIFEADVIIFALSGNAFSQIWEQIKENIPQNTILVSLCKTIITETLMTTTEMFLQKSTRVALLTGGSFGFELKDKTFTAFDLCSTDKEVALLLKLMFSKDYIHIKTRIGETFLIQASYAGPAKNVLAVSKGIFDGMNLADNTKFVLLNEMKRELYIFIEHFVGIYTGLTSEQREYFSNIRTNFKNNIFSVDQKSFLENIQKFSPTKLQTLWFAERTDYELSLFGKSSRNRQFGEYIGKGRKYEDLKKEFQNHHVTVEGVYSFESLITISKIIGTEVPLIEYACQAIHQEISLELFLDQCIQYIKTK